MSIPMKLEKAKLVKTAGAGGGLGGAIGGMAASAAAGAVGVDGMIPTVWTDSEMQFRFNPTQLTLSKAAVFGGSTPPRSEEGGDEQYTGPSTRTLGFTVFLDEWEAPAGADVGEMVTKLQHWCNPEDPTAERPDPPTVMFVWGKFNFTGQLESVNATFDLFRKDGTPARAEVQLSMKERPTQTTGTNPTSGGPPGRRSRMIVENDTLQGVAYRELGDAGLWRVIAEMNGIDDPTTIPAGTTVFVPSPNDARQARRLARNS